MGDIIDSQALAIGRGAIAEVVSQVRAEFVDDNPELCAAVDKLAKVLEEDSPDRPGILSTLSHVLGLLIDSPDAIKNVRLLIVAALQAVGILES